MKDLIIQELNNAFVILETRIPQTKKNEKSISIIDVEPMELISFMEANNIPKNASFGGRDNGYDAWDDIILEWDIDVPTTDKDKLEFKRTKFTDISWKLVYDTLTKNGYTRISFSSELLIEFKDTTLYDMYINKEFDRIVKYYSFRFVLIDNK